MVANNFYIEQLDVRIQYVNIRMRLAIPTL